MILMLKNLNEQEKVVLDKMHYLVGSAQILAGISKIAPKRPFDKAVLAFLNTVSKNLMKDTRSREYSDVVTLGFWLRKASLRRLEEKYGMNDEDIHFGRGVAFHIAPSNVPVNFAYSLVSGLLMGNANVIRIPSKDFPQVDIIAEAINNAIEGHEDMKNYIILVRYGRDAEINDYLSSIADSRIIWGGDQTIADIRKSVLPPRSNEVTFANRYSLAVIDSDEYVRMAVIKDEGDCEGIMQQDNNEAKRIAQDFYNDTYFSDQNACTSPRIIIWVGDQKEAAKKIFWTELHKLVEEKYTFQAITGINKLTSSYLIAVDEPGSKIIEHDDNLIIRVYVPRISNDIMRLMDNCGYFFEYDCDNILDIRPLCDDKRCQTIGLLGNKDILKPLFDSGIKGVDRVASFGHTMDFELIWDGYDLPAILSRTIKFNMPD